MPHLNSHGWFSADLNYKHVSTILTSPWRFHKDSFPSLPRAEPEKTDGSSSVALRPAVPASGNGQGKEFQRQWSFSKKKKKKKKKILLPFPQNSTWDCNSSIIGYAVSQQIARCHTRFSIKEEKKKINRYGKIIKPLTGYIC